MSTPASRPNLTSIAAACILSGGLIAAAIIDSHKPVTIIGGSPVPLVAEAAAVTTPPIPQESVGSQAEAQILATPIVHRLQYKGSACNLLAAKATLVEYTPKDDQFYVSFDLNWKKEDLEETVKSDSSVATHVWGSGTETPPATCSVTLSNDGYGHYFGPCAPDGTNFFWIKVANR